MPLKKENLFTTSKKTHTHMVPKCLRFHCVVFCALYLLKISDVILQDAGVVVKKDETDSKPKKVKACSLDKPTQDLVKMIFDNDMFNNAMQKLELGESNAIQHILCVHMHSPTSCPGIPALKLCFMPT